MLYQAELRPEWRSLEPRLAEPVHPAVEASAQERIVDAQGRV